MSERMNEDWLSDLETDELRKRIYLEQDKYEPDVVEAFKEALQERFSKNPFEAEDLKLYELLETVNNEELESVISSHFTHLYGSRTEYFDLLELLRHMEPSPDQQVTLELLAGSNALSGSGADWFVLGREAGEEEPVELTYCAWKDWLGYQVKPSWLKLLGIPLFLMIVFANMTKAGMTEEAIQAEFDAVTQGMAELEGEWDDSEDADDSRL